MAKPFNNMIIPVVPDAANDGNSGNSRPRLNIADAGLDCASAKSRLAWLVKLLRLAWLVRLEAGWLDKLAP